MSEKDTQIYENLWVRKEARGMKEVVRVGVTEQFTHNFNSIESVRLLQKLRCVNEGFPFGLIEQGKRKAILKSPVSGLILEINEKVLQNPKLINEDPYGEGWLILINSTVGGKNG